MHACPECGKNMATAGGLEIHGQIAHAAPAPPAPEPVAPPPSPAVEPQPAMYPPAVAEARTYRPMLRGYDPTLPLTAVLVLALLVAGLTAAVHRSVVHPATSAIASGGTPPASATTPTSSLPGAAPQPTTPLTQPPLFSGQQPSGSAGATATPTTPTAPCPQVIGSLRTTPSRRTAELAGLMRARTFPSLPLAGFESPSVTSLTRYDTVQQFLTDFFDPADPAAALWQNKLATDGFVGAETVDYENQGERFTATALRFATPAGAVDFNRATLTAACEQDVLQHAQALPKLTGGMDYIITEAGAPPYRASFVAGDTVVRLNLCHCVTAPDDQALAGQWAQVVAGAVGAG